MSVILTYDGSFEGFLSSVFIAYEQKTLQAKIIRFDRAAPTFFEKTETVITNETNADRVWKGLKKKCANSGLNNLYCAFLSEMEHVETLLFSYIKQAFKAPNPIDGDFSNPIVLQISKIVKMVGREKHRMDAFIRFKLTKDNIYFATIEPDFNVLPLNTKHFKNRYADQKWLIYDIKRQYGVYYNLETTATVELTLEQGLTQNNKQDLYFTEDEFAYEELWKNYFKSTNIESRKNMKLHIRHVPKRYWKYLAEKKPFN